MRFSWDPANAEKNRRLHGVSFETACEVFDDPNQSENCYIAESGEQRYQIIGMTRNLALLLVVFVDPGSNVIRLISARKAVEYEKSVYNDQFQ
jgi:uncharacterized protein